MSHQDRIAEIRRKWPDEANWKQYADELYAALESERSQRAALEAELGAARKVVEWSRRQLGQMQGHTAKLIAEYDATRKEAPVQAVEAPSPHIVDKFSNDLGCTVRDCLGCGALVPGGPTRCKRCAAPESCFPARKERP